MFEVRPWLRLSDQDRERAVRFLSVRYREGYVGLDTFTERVAGVYGARATGQVEALVGDLPGHPSSWWKRTKEAARTVWTNALEGERYLPAEPLVLRPDRQGSLGPGRL